MKKFLVFLVLFLIVAFAWMGCQKETPIEAVNGPNGGFGKIVDDPELALLSYNYYGELHSNLAPNWAHQEIQTECPFIKYDASVGKYYCDNGDPSVSDESLLMADDYYGSQGYGSAFDMFLRPSETAATLGYPGSGYVVSLVGSEEESISELLPPTYSDLNPSFESWTTSEALRPIAWQVSELSGTGYDVPSSWTTTNYFSSLNQEYGGAYDGTYSVRIPISSIERSKVLASGYFMIPVGSQASGEHSMTFHVKGNVGVSNAVYIAGAFYNTSGTLMYEVTVFIPAGNYTNWQPVSLSYNAANPVAYVRFAVKTASRVSIVTTLDADMIQLRNPNGDVSLPVELLYFDFPPSGPGYETGNPYNYADDYFNGVWATGSEIDNNYFELMGPKTNGNPGFQLASTGYQVPGAGTTNITTYYSYRFPIDYGLAYYLKSLCPDPWSAVFVSFCLRSRDYDGTYHLYNDSELVKTFLLTYNY